MQSHLELVKENGLDRIYCSLTGVELAKMSDEALEAFIDIEEALHAFESEDAFLDHIELAMFAANSRPHPILQNLTPARYSSMIKLYPALMLRYMVGKMIFERWTNGRVVESPNKQIWLREIAIPEEVDVIETLNTLVRLDGIMGLRRVFLSDFLIKRIHRIQESFPGFNTISKLIEDVEINCMLHMAEVEKTPKLTPNQNAQQALMRQISDTPSEAFVEFQSQMRVADKLRQLQREYKSHEAMTNHVRRINEAVASGNTITVRGVQAIVDWAALDIVENKQLALQLLSKMDTARIAVKQRIDSAAKKVVKLDPNKAKVVKTASKSKKFNFTIQFTTEESFI